ncbi:MAG: hypothetical protein K8S98_11850 [Planctomycetes bacterium]|nr:hypothetical protein [Planctomycetota bacterium]
MKTLLRSAVALSVLSLVALAANDDQVTLRWKLKQGDSLRYRMTQDQSTESEMMGEKETHSGFVLRESVTAVAADGVATVGVKYEAAKLESTGMGAMSYDSTRTGDAAKKNDPKLAKIFEPMLQAQLSMKLEPTGRVVEIKGMQEMFEKSFGAAASDNPMDVASIMKDAFNEDAIKRLVEINVFPAEPIAPGKKWNRAATQKLPMMGNLQFDFENTFVGVEEHAGVRCAKIQLGGKMTLEPVADKRMPMNVSMDSTSISGTMFFDLDKGRLVELETNTEMDMHLSAGGEASAGMKMDMTMSGTTRMLLIGDDAPMFP